MSKPVTPEDRRALIAVDLGAESCRVSLLRWRGERAQISLVHRFDNAARETVGGLRWDLRRIEEGLDEGLRRCAAVAEEGVRSIAVDGWSVDYVYLGGNDERGDEIGEDLGDSRPPIADPFCYRDERTVRAERSLHERCRPERMRELTGVHLLRINTVYQMHADALAGVRPGRQWLNLPEYILFRWGGARVAELTNATHTQMVDLDRPQWCAEIFRAAQIDVACAPTIVLPGTVVGRLTGDLAKLPSLRDVILIAPACHDTASAIAGIPADGEDWAYLSSGTWSLVGTLLDAPCNAAAAAAEQFTNLRGVGNRICFHKNVNGMWLIRQCIEAWAMSGRRWTVSELVAAAEEAEQIDGMLDVDEADLLLPGRMPGRINAQRRRNGYGELDETPAGAPAFASLIFHSLAARYASVLKRIESHTGKRLRRLIVVGGGSQNEFLNRLTREATGLEVVRGAAESSTVGNFAVQLATLEGSREPSSAPTAPEVSAWAAQLVSALEGTAQDADADTSDGAG